MGKQKKEKEEAGRRGGDREETGGVAINSRGSTPGGLLLGGGAWRCPWGFCRFQSTGSTVRRVSNMEVSSDVTVPGAGCLKTSPAMCNQIRGARKGKGHLYLMYPQKEKDTLVLVFVFVFVFENKIDTIH